MAHISVYILLLSMTLAVSGSDGSFDGANSTLTRSDATQTSSKSSLEARNSTSSLKGVSPLCSALANFPLSENEKLGFEKGELASLCKPFAQRTRASLDMCGDTNLDPYTSAYTWPSRDEMVKRGKINIFTDPQSEQLYSAVVNRAEEIRRETTQLCCASDSQCESAMARVEVSLCKPKENSSDPDSCVFGGYYEMPRSGYEAMYTHLYQSYSDVEMRKIPVKNLRTANIIRLERDMKAGKLTDVQFPQSGRIVLSSYVSARDGIQSLEPTLRHEFGHACSMIKMQTMAAAGKTPSDRDRAVRASQWLDQVKERCQASSELPDAYYDFWQSVGESREFAGCLYKLTRLNQEQKIDRPCPKLCPGHYLEEAVGITFSLLTGDLTGVKGAVFPNTCNHVRDGQHPMVSDVVDCLTQHSPRFRARLKQAYACAT